MADLPAYPNTRLAVGVVDPPFGGIPAGRFGELQQTHQDARSNEAARQLVATLWSGSPIQYRSIADGGLAGDVIVFDSTGNNIDGSPVYRPLKNVTYDPDVYGIAGILLAPVSADQKGPITVGGGHLLQAVTGLSVGANGPATIDMTTGRVRLRAIGEPTFGWIDLNGNCFLLPLGVAP